MAPTISTSRTDWVPHCGNKVSAGKGIPGDVQPALPRKHQAQLGRYSIGSSLVIINPESGLVITQRALHRATWHMVGTWRSSPLSTAPHPVTRLLQVSVSLFSTPRDTVQGSSPTCRRYAGRLDGVPGRCSVWLQCAAEHRPESGGFSMGIV